MSSNVIKERKMKKKFKIGLLTTIDNPLLPFFIKGILVQKLNDIIVICDSKMISKKNKKIWFERTGKAFERGDNEKFNIYTLDTEKIPFYFVKNHNNSTTEELIKNLKFDVLLNAGTPRKLSSNILKSTKHGVLNIHPGLLPEYRGCSAVEWAIYNDEKVANTAHFMTEEYDEGPIIKSEFYEFPSDLDYKSIRLKVYKNGCSLAGKALSLMKEKNMIPSDGIIQNESVSKYWNPIPQNKFEKVIEKIIQKKYTYQTNEKNNIS